MKIVGQIGLYLVKTAILALVIYLSVYSGVCMALLKCFPHLVGTQ